MNFPNVGQTQTGSTSALQFFKPSSTTVQKIADVPSRTMFYPRKKAVISINREEEHTGEFKEDA
jgi:hypothetical protein